MKLVAQINELKQTQSFKLSQDSNQEQQEQADLEKKEKMTQAIEKLNKVTLEGVIIDKKKSAKFDSDEETD